MFDTVMQYVTSVGMLMAAGIVGYKLIQDEITYRRNKRR